VRAEIWQELTRNEGATSAIQSHDKGLLTWGPGAAMTGSLPAILTGAFNKDAIRDLFHKHGIDWAAGAFAVFNETTNAIDSGGAGLTLIRGRPDLLAVFTLAAESPDTAQGVADLELSEVDRRIAGLPTEIHDGWDLDVLRFAFHLDYAAGAYGYSKHQQAYVDTGGKIGEVIMAWGRLAAGNPEASGAYMISAPGWALTIKQFREWGHGVAWKAVQAVCPVPIAIGRAEIRDANRTELADRLLIRNLEADGDEPRGFYVMPKMPEKYPNDKPPVKPEDAAQSLYFAFYELNGVPPEMQLGRAAQYRLDDLDKLIAGWDDGKNSYSKVLSAAVGLSLKAVRLRKRQKAPGKVMDPDADALVASPEFKAVQDKEPDRAKRISDYLGL
jgi:hypothetical protein